MKVRIDRLKKCLASLPRRETKREKFDLAYAIVDDECCTTACAFGWYMLKHPRCGLRRRRYLPLQVPRHFGISPEDYFYLFTFNGNPAHDSLRGTRARLRKFISDHEVSQ